MVGVQTREQLAESVNDTCEDFCLPWEPNGHQPALVLLPCPRCAANDWHVVHGGWLAMCEPSGPNAEGVYTIVHAYAGAQFTICLCLSCKAQWFVEGNAEPSSADAAFGYELERALNARRPA